MSRASALGLATLALVGCGESDSSTPRADSGQSPPVAKSPRAKADTPLRAPRCPVGAANCAVATGSVLTLEAVDPDGDGDAHLILLSPQAITAPGISVIDVKRELRPHPLPRPGDLVAAAGPVYRGSYGQRQIQAVELRVSRRHWAPRHRPRAARRPAGRSTNRAP